MSDEDPDQPTEELDVEAIRLAVSVAAGLDALVPTTGRRVDDTGFSNGTL